MENQDEESTSTHPNHQLDSPSRELQAAPHHQQAPKRDRSKSPSPKRSKNAKPTQQPIFPFEIIIEILSKLPVKSLLRFRCVSKSWNSLIADPFFIKKHLQHTQTDPKFAKKRVLINTGNTQAEVCIKSCSLRSVYEDPAVNSVDIEYPSKKASRFDWIVGSCNGLVCIAIKQDTVFLLNPTLRVSKRLPDLGFKKRRGCYTVYGFGFDASANDYKVVRVFCYQNRGFEDGYESIVRVYSLRTNCWRRIQDFSYGVPCDEVGKYVNGTLNWVVFRKRNMEFSWMIISLDLAREVYKEVLQPSYGDGASEKMLGVLDGCLCVLCTYGRVYADVWVMREYGKGESWTKLVTVPSMPFPASGLFSTPLFVSESGEILVHSGAKLILYNPKENDFRTPVHDEAISYIEQAEIYVESLVSPTAVNQCH